MTPTRPRGQTADIPLFDLTEQFEAIQDSIHEALNRVLCSQRFVLGTEVEDFEQALSERLGGVHVVGCASGTDALLLSLKALRAPRDTEVVVPAFTFFASAGAVWNAGLRPAFCDVDPGTFNVTLSTVQEAWTGRTRAVVPVHLFGQMAPMADLIGWARDRDLFVLEDAAQALGATGAGGLAGGTGDAAAISFFPTKNLGAFGEGGAVATLDARLAKELRKLRVHGEVERYRHDVVGTNSRLHALQAAVLGAKLTYLAEWTAARRRNAALYEDLLAELPQVTTPAVLSGNLHVYNQYTICAVRRDDLLTHLRERGIGCAVYYPIPLHLQECFASLGYGRGDFPVAERLADEVLSLPVYPELGEARLRQVASAIRQFYGS